MANVINKMFIALSSEFPLYLKPLWFPWALDYPLWSKISFTVQSQKKITFVDYEIRAFLTNVYFIATVRYKQSEFKTRSKHTETIQLIQIRDS